MTSPTVRLVARVVVAVWLIAAAASASAQEVRVMTSGGFTAAYLEVVPQFEHEAKQKVLTAFGASMGNAPDSIPVRLQRGEPVDVVILASGALDDLIKAGKVMPGSRVDLVRSTIGMAVRAGAAKPDISTVEALKRTLLNARSIAYSASASGTYLATELFPRLGIAEQIKDKAKRIESERVGTIVARGDAEIGFQQVSELLPVPGVDYVGPLPGDTQRVTVFSAGIAAGSKNPDGARALIRFLASSSAFPAIAKAGLEPAQEDALLTREHTVPVRSSVPSMAGQQAQIYVRERLRAGATANADRVVLFIHGAGTPAEVAFDVPYADYSWMAYLAREGFDVFSMDVTGYGRSTRPPVMNDPCNLAPDRRAGFVPAGTPCTSSDAHEATTIASDWNDINAVVDYVRTLRRVPTVSLVAWSLGGPRAAGYAAQNPDKVGKLVLLAPAYNRALPDAAPAVLPVAGIAMNTQSRAEFAANWDRQVGCPDQYESRVADSVWGDMLASDPVGATWGPGVRRAPQTTTWGWSRAMVGRTRTPTLMIAGVHDKQVPPERVRQLYADLGAPQKVFVDLGCSSHNAMWERNHALLFRASLEWLTRGTVNGTSQGMLRIGYPALAPAAQTAGAPRFRVDPSWPTIPNNWQLGQVASVSVDGQDHIWVLQRPSTLESAEKPRAAPPVLEFDAGGTLVQAWGGPGTGFEWPESEHGIYLDPKGFVWIGGNGEKDHQILKFTRDGKFVMQIGRAGQSKGNTDTANLNQPADTFVYAKTNELFVADGYGNRRVIVFDADTGRFKRMWGAFGNVPTDAAPNPALPDAEPNGPPQFVQPVHAARVSNDGLVYVSERGGKRVQIFTVDGTFVNQIFIGRECIAPACGNGTTAASTAFSTDPEQKYLYVGNRSQAQVMVFERKTLTLLDRFGQWGSAPGDFGTLHHMGVDSKGNLYVTEVTPLQPENRRIQKFILLPAP